MSNSLGIELKGKIVVIGKEHLLKRYHELEDRLFEVTGGFGSSPHTIGTALMGRFLKHGKDRLEGFMVERLAKENEYAEILAAEKEAQEEAEKAAEDAPKCPHCGHQVFRIGQLTFNWQNFDAAKEDWGPSYDYAYDGDYQVCAICDACEKDITEHLMDRDWQFHDEQTLKIRELALQKGQKMLNGLDNKSSS